MESPLIHNQISSEKSKHWNFKKQMIPLRKVSERKLSELKIRRKKFLIKEDGYEVEDPFFKQWIVLQSVTAV